MGHRQCAARRTRLPCSAVARLVPLPSRKDRLHVRQPRVPALQRNGQSLGPACAALTTAPVRSPDDSHEPVCARAGDVGGAAAAIARGQPVPATRRGAPAAVPADDAVDRILHPGRSSADALPAARVSATADPVRRGVEEPRALLAGHRCAVTAGLRRRMRGQPAIPVCAGRQSRLSRHDRAAPARHPRNAAPLPRSHRAHGVAGRGRSTEAGAGLRSHAHADNGDTELHRGRSRESRGERRRVRHGASLLDQVRPAAWQPEPERRPW